MDKNTEAMLYILEHTKNNDITGKGLSFFYDVLENRIKPDALKGTYCSSSEALIRIAFNLFNGWTEDGKFNDIYHLMWDLDENNRRVVMDTLSMLYL